MQFQAAALIIFSNDNYLPSNFQLLFLLYQAFWIFPVSTRSGKVLSTPGVWKFDIADGFERLLPATTSINRDVMTLVITASLFLVFNDSGARLRSRQSALNRCREN